MTQKEAILKEVQGIPETFLTELFDFIQFLKMKAAEEKFNTTLMSESSLGKDWNRPEEDEAWKNL
ncbi:MAG: DUF2281 domain-containing protein [Planctomycetota bacterium]|nr:DUF2281 domain-containing protein [Planctomycetota bacterium]